MSIDLYQHVNEQIIQLLEKGDIPWRRPIAGGSGAGWPKNMLTQLAYRGINVFLLAIASWSQGYQSSYWVTFNQALQLGGSVKKGEKSSMVLFWKEYKTADRTTGDPKTVPVLRYFRVFNVQQCDGIAIPDVTDQPPLAFTPIEAAERIVEGFEGRPDIRYEGLKPHYRPVSDQVVIPDKTRFISVEEFYSTLFHELAHSTGHQRRLGRGVDTNLQPFGSPDYSKEELIAEMAATYLCAHAKIEPATIQNSAAYIQGWLKVLKSDKRMVIQAAAAAQKAADWIRGERGR